MLNRRPRTPARSLALTLCVVLPSALTLAACGDGEESFSGLDAVEISGPVGSTPELAWNGVLEAGDVDSAVLEEGDGPEIADGDSVLVNYTMANGFTQQVTYDTYDEYTVGALVTVGDEAEPQSIADLLTAAIADEIEAGQTIGSRIAVTVGSDELLGDYLGNATVSQFAVSLDIGNEDGLLFVADLTALAGPVGTEEAAPAWAPAIVEEDGVPASLDFTGTPAPSGDLRVATLVRGEGPVVTSGQTILTSYLGQVSKGEEPFDESYSTGRGLEAVVGGPSASVVKGWSQGLVGLPVGSRVLLEIPPKLGYGKEGSGETIPPNSTLYFVVDILDAADPEPAPEPSASPSASPSVAE